MKNAKIGKPAGRVNNHRYKIKPKKLPQTENEINESNTQKDDNPKNPEPVKGGKPIKPISRSTSPIRGKRN